MYRTIVTCTLGLSLLMASPGFAQESSGPSERSAVVVRKEANSAYERKDYAECAKLFQETAQLGSGRAAMNDYYNAACCYGRSGDLERAFDVLKRAVEAGYQNVNHMKGDSDLENLRCDPRWQELLATIDVPPIRITEDLTTNPTKAPFVYEDVHNFMHAMTLIAEGEDAAAILEKEYFGKATPGLKQFVTKYGLTPEAVAAAMKKLPVKYEQLGQRLAQLKSREAALRASLVRFKEVVPQAVFPPTYFLVADHSGIASGSPDGQLITLERRTRESIDRIETLLVHELFHLQQLKAAGPDELYALFGEKKSLLGLAIREGAAEFVAKRVTGRITQEDALDYVLKYERDIWRRFQPQMMGRDTRGWMWSKPTDPDQPRDAAYALGSRIVEAYYRKVADKRQAMQAILSVTDYPSFLEESGYGQRGEP